MENNFINSVKGQGAFWGSKDNQVLDGVKITNAVYSLLDFFPQDDPLKNKAKEKALAILENFTLVFGAQGWVSLQKEKTSAKLIDDIEILKNYLSIAKHSGWISNINFFIISEEYNKIKSQINPPKGIVKKSMEETEKIVQGNKQNPPKIREISRPKYTNRQDKILEMLSRTESGQVSDFIKELPNITKRTIRRDLDELMKMGRITRVGDFNKIFYKIVRN